MHRLPTGPRRGSPPADPHGFVRQALRPTPIPALPELRLNLAHAGSRLGRLGETGLSVAGAPYWAYAWPGGTALARHVLDFPETVRGRRVLDLGAGCGVVAVAAALAGAAQVSAADVDPFAAAATAYNAASNGVRVALVASDLTGPAPENIDVILAGDVFYEASLAETMTLHLSRCRCAGIDILVGDIGRAWLPLARLEKLADYAAADVGDRTDAPGRRAGVYSLTA
ncbi:MAG: methyltransferase [Rhizobiaceae bacterium]|nr:methyltransferase [Rhizobiaceae bacterium]